MADEDLTRLRESTLYKENVFVKKHRSVWGSWYDNDKKSWGYGCCRGLDKNAECTDLKRKADEMFPEEPQASDSGIEKTSESDSDAKKTEQAPWPFEKLAPAKLLTPEELQAQFKAEGRKEEKMRPEKLDKKRKGEYVTHFVHYVLARWREDKESKFASRNFTDEQKITFKDYKSAEQQLTPLMWRLKRGDDLERGEKKRDPKGPASRETRTSMEGKYVKERNVLDSLFDITNMAREQNYFDANGVYMKLTFGNKMWNLTHVAHVAACTMKGAREYRRNRDSLNTYDNDPVSQKYMHGLRKLVHYAQLLNPSPDQSQNFVM
eukprot:TRINITY_DN23003_c0_g1_i1.p1 TRINITY_DN23003_c0_g1~~TRINITY_DN23003_c0_g1_i1.p1  ORF type:complete len:321 (-),score=70.17 TRINITY_DN23003_c0_g1_i1:88-1050(-)